MSPRPLRLFGLTVPLVLASLAAWAGVVREPAPTFDHAVHTLEAHADAAKRPVRGQVGGVVGLDRHHVDVVQGHGWLAPLPDVPVDRDGGHGCHGHRHRRAQ